MQSSLIFTLIENRLKNGTLKKEEIEYILTELPDVLPLNILKLIDIKKYSSLLCKCVNIDKEILDILCHYNLYDKQIFHENISEDNLIYLSDMLIYDLDFKCKNMNLNTLLLYKYICNLEKYFEEDTPKKDILKILRSGQLSNKSTIEDNNYILVCKNWDIECLEKAYEKGLRYNLKATIEHPNIGPSILIKHPEWNWESKMVTSSKAITKAFFEVHLNDFPWDIETLLKRDDLK